MVEDPLQDRRYPIDLTHHEDTGVDSPRVLRNGIEGRHPQGRFGEVVLVEDVVDEQGAQNRREDKVPQDAEPAFLNRIGICLPKT